MLEQLAQEYVTTARIKGLSEMQVTLHAFRNIGVQLLTVIVLAYGGLLDGAVLTETVFAWPGLGRLMYDSIYARDYPVLMAIALLTAAARAGVRAAGCGQGPASRCYRGRCEERGWHRRARPRP